MKLTALSSNEHRNYFRGALSNSDEKALLTTLDHARKSLSRLDAPIFAQLMAESELEEAYYGAPFPNLINRIYWTNFRQQIDVALEAAMQQARVLFHGERLLQASVDFSEINQLCLAADFGAAVSGVCDFIEKYGYSAAIARKAIYIHSRLRSTKADLNQGGLDKSAGEVLSRFIDGTESPMFAQFTNLMLDICDVEVACFDVHREHTRILKDPQIDDKAFPPHRVMMRRILFPTLYSSIVDPVGLLFFSSSSAIDLLIDLVTASFAPKDDPTLRELFSSTLFLTAKANLQVDSEVLRCFLNMKHGEETEQAAYRAAATFPEIAPLARWRRAVDFEFYSREKWKMPPEPAPDNYFPDDLKLRHLCTEGSGALKSLARFDNANANCFLRTAAVLNRLRAGERLTDLDTHRIRILLSQTTGFSRLLSKDELIALRQKSKGQDSDVITFLAMVMLNEQSPSEDLSFEMRMAFQGLVREKFRSDIIAFLGWLHGRTPVLCHVIIDLCDISFLERLYLLNESYSQVLSMREKICRWTAEKFGRLDYVDIADRLALDAKVRKIRGEIDETRIFVDEIRFQQWSIDTIGSSLRKFERMVSVSPPITSRPNQVKGAGHSRLKSKVSVASSEYWFRIACQNAFHEFCHNKIFGIDSYLSRRIRHGTLAGTLISPVQSRIANFRQTNARILSGTDQKALNGILNEYRAIVAEIRDEMLHFRSDSKPRGLLFASAWQTTTRRSLNNEFREQIVSLFKAGFTTSDLSPLFIAHCWELLFEDLLRVQGELRTTFNKRVRPLMRSACRSHPNEQLWRQLAADLDQTTETLFSTLYKWFTKPERASMTVSIEELLTVVVEEVGAYWPDYKRNWRFVEGGGQIISGVTYHTTYDILYVLFNNIAEHADAIAETLVNVTFDNASSGDGEVLHITVVSKNKRQVSDASVIEAINEALARDSQSDSMVREGRSGLGKARALVNSFAGMGTFDWYVSGGTCCIDFKIPIVVIGN